MTTSFLHSFQQFAEQNQERVSSLYDTIGMFGMTPEQFYAWLNSLHDTAKSSGVNISNMLPNNVTLDPAQVYSYVEFFLNSIQSAANAADQYLPEKKFAKLQQLSQYLFLGMQNLNDSGLLVPVITTVAGPQMAQQIDRAMRLIANTAQVLANALYLTAKKVKTKINGDAERTENQLNNALKNILKATYASPILNASKHIKQARNAIATIIISPPSAIFSLPERLNLTGIMTNNFEETWENIIRTKNERNNSNQGMFQRAITGMRNMLPLGMRNMLPLGMRNMLPLGNPNVVPAAQRENTAVHQPIDNQTTREAIADCAKDAYGILSNAGSTLTQFIASRTTPEKLALGAATAYITVRAVRKLRG